MYASAQNSFASGQMASQLRAIVPDAPPAPPTILSIELEHRPGRRSYTANEALRGQIVLDSYQDEAIDHIDIEFVGIVRTASSEFSGDRLCTLDRRLVLCRYATTLVTISSKILPPGRHVWPFLFHWPEVTEEPKTGLEMRDMNIHKKELIPSHPIPPSMSAFTTSNGASVRYRVIGKLVRPKENWRAADEDVTVERVVPYVPRFDEANGSDSADHTFDRQVSIKSLELDGRRGSISSISLKDRWKALKKSDDLPTAVYTLCVSFPTVFYQNEPVTINFKFRPLSMPPGVTSLPVTVRMTKLKSRGIATARTQDFENPAKCSGHKFTVITEAIMATNHDLLDFSEENSYMCFFNSTPISTQMPPNFKTYNLDRTHNLSIRIEVLFLNKCWGVIEEEVEVTLRPPRIINGRDPYPASPVEIQDTEGLPAYEA